MRVWIVAVALLAACRGDRARPHRDDAAPASRSLVPKLLPSEDPAAALARLDGEVALYQQRGELPAAIGALVDRAGIHGRVEDYQAALALSQKFLDTATGPSQKDAWRLRTRVLTRVHRFTEARAALEHVKTGALNATEWRELEAAIDEASGQLDKSAPVREQVAKDWGSTTNLVSLAGSLAAQDKLDDALAVMPKAAAALHDNSPELLAYLLFQWGRIYELRGEPAAAREFYAAARTRLPTLEETTHLAQAMVATGDVAAAKKLVTDELAHDRHPELLALAAQLGHDDALAAEARREWDRYVAALPEAFSDHAARFYLTIDPQHALVLARANLANRDTREARALVVEAALAAKDPAAACEVVGALATSPLRTERFTAWRALSACGHSAEAEKLGNELGIRN